MENNENPFEIKEDLELTRNSSNLLMVNRMLDQLVKLEPNNKRQSISIPLTVCPSKREADNFIVTLRRVIDDSEDGTINDVTFTKRVIMSEDKTTYLGTRVWRLT